MDPTELSLARAEPTSVAPAESLTPAGSPQGRANLFVRSEGMLCSLIYSILYVLCVPRRRPSPQSGSVRQPARRPPADEGWSAHLVHLRVASARGGTASGDKTCLRNDVA